jgi:Myb-like DNA-binding domain
MPCFAKVTACRRQVGQSNLSSHNPIDGLDSSRGQGPHDQLERDCESDPRPQQQGLPETIFQRGVGLSEKGESRRPTSLPTSVMSSGAATLLLSCPPVLTFFPHRQGPWTEAEDSRLKSYVQQSGLSWAVIAQKMENRSADRAFLIEPGRWHRFTNTGDHHRVFKALASLFGSSLRSSTVDG